MLESHKWLNKTGLLKILLDSRLRGNDVTLYQALLKTFLQRSLAV